MRRATLLAALPAAERNILLDVALEGSMMKIPMLCRRSLAVFAVAAAFMGATLVPSGADVGKGDTSADGSAKQFVRRQYLASADAQNLGCRGKRSSVQTHRCQNESGKLQ
jgi:hypothetical protein